jgi:hypothetical protein
MYCCTPARYIWWIFKHKYAILEILVLMTVIKLETIEAYLNLRNTKVLINNLMQLVSLKQNSCILQHEPRIDATEITLSTCDGITLSKCSTKSLIPTTATFQILILPQEMMRFKLNVEFFSALPEKLLPFCKIF